MENTITKQKNTDITPYKKTLSLIEQKATDLIIKTVEEMKSASDLLFQISKLSEAIRDKKNKTILPARAIIKEANDTFGPIEKSCINAEISIKAKMVIFSNKQSEIAQKKLAGIAENLTNGKIDLAKASEKIGNLNPQNSYSGLAGAISFREHKVIKITDETKIPRVFLIPDFVRIRTAVLSGLIIPGVEIKIEKIVAKSHA